MRETDLPPKPDLQTGEPRPPRAPLDPDWKRPDDKHKNGLKRVPEPPDGNGPILEWFHPTRSGSIATGLIGSIVCFVFLVFKDGGLGWVTVWWLWLFVLPWPFVFWLIGRSVRMSAGADWFAYNNKVFVKTYELSEVKVSAGGTGRFLRMKDQSGRRAYIKLDDIQRNRELWDLVYNGIQHSVYVHGAETNKMAKDFLGLNMPPQYR